MTAAPRGRRRASPRRAGGGPRFDVVTLFPEMFEGPLGLSILGRARRRGLLRVGFVNPRDFARDRHRTVDDRPYGGGRGMILMAEPLYQALRSARRPGSKAVYLSPQGKPFTQATARQFSREKHIVLLCGHYEGVDERILRYVDLELSVGDYVLTGGEIPAMVVIDATLRLVPGVLPEGAAERDSFGEGLAFDHPQYTRPRVWRGAAAPAELLGGDHARIEAWRRQAALDAVRSKRPDLLMCYNDSLSWAKRRARRRTPRPIRTSSPETSSAST